MLFLVWVRFVSFAAIFVWFQVRQHTFKIVSSSAGVNVASLFASSSSADVTWVGFGEWIKKRFSTRVVVLVVVEDDKFNETLVETNTLSWLRVAAIRVNMTMTMLTSYCIWTSHSIMTLYRQLANNVWKWLSRRSKSLIIYCLARYSPLQTS